MKTKVLTLLTGILFLTTIVNAQIEAIGYSFQGYAVDAESKALGNEDIKVKFTITPDGYTEEHSLTTDVFGVFTTIVGSLDPPTFKKINYSTLQSLKVEVKKLTGSYTTIHNGQLQSVPYAQYANNGVPVGTIIIYAGNGANIPGGWLPCDGRTLNLTANPEHTALASVVNSAGWGGSNKLPDLRNAFLKGAQPGIREVGSNEDQATAMPTLPFEGEALPAGEHQHDYNDVYHTVSTGSNLINGGSGPVATSDGANKYGNEYTRETFAEGTHNHTVEISGGDSETRPANTAVLYIIKY